jgi:1,4-alpha-glucan branching enzyme
MKKPKATKPQPAAPVPVGATAPLSEFKIMLPKAQSVALAGSFNGWDPKRTPLRREADGCWRVFLPLAPGRYEYRYVLDGQWIDDPNAKQFAANPHGTRNAVLVVPAQAPVA